MVKMLLTLISLWSTVSLIRNIGNLSPEAFHLCVHVSGMIILMNIVMKNTIRQK